jgi:hypothetical protein
MMASLLKWFASLGTGAAVAALAYVAANLGAGPDIDPFLAGVVTGAVSKLVSWLTSKIPA